MGEGGGFPNPRRLSTLIQKISERDSSSELKFSRLHRTSKVPSTGPNTTGGAGAEPAKGLPEGSFIFQGIMSADLWD